MRLKRNLGSCFVHNHDPVLLKLGKENLDIYSIHNYSKALTYMTAYFSKSDIEFSESLKQAAREIKNQKLKCE